MPARLELTLLLAVVTGASACFGQTTGGASVKSKEGVRVLALQQHQLRVVPAEPRSFRNEYVAAGQISYNEDAVTPVHSPFSGRIVRLSVKLGDTVARGDPLCEIRSTDVVQLHNDLIAAGNAHAKSRDRLAYTKRVLDRQNALLAARATSQKDLEVARGDQDAAEAEFKAASGALDAARNRFEVMLSRTPAEREGIEREGSIDPIVVIRAPIGGTIISRKVGPGQFVKSEANEVLFAIADLSTMWLKMNVPESKAPLVQIGDSVDVAVSAFPDKPLRARITGMSSMLDPSTRRIAVRSEVPNPERALKADMFASGRIVAGAGEESPAVPIGAVIRDGDETSVWVEVGPFEYKRRIVKIGAESQGLLQIRDGLMPGERVVARGAIFLDNEWRQ